MQQQISVGSSNRVCNLILSQEPAEDFNDFLNHSLSEGGTYSIDIFKKLSYDQQQVQKQFTITSVLESHPQSPDSKQQIINQNQNQQFVSASQSKKGTTFNFTRKVTQKNAFTNLMQYFHMKKFLNRIIWKKKINSLFNIDKASSFNLKLFKEHSINFKMSPNMGKKNESQQESFCEQTLKKCQKWFQEVYFRLDVILSKVPLFYPDARLKIFFDCLVLFARFYFMFTIPLDLSFSSSQIMYSEWLGITLFMMILMFIDFFLSFNTAYYESGQIVINRCKIAANNVSKSFGTELISVLLLLVFMLIYKTSDKFEINVSTQSYQIILLIFFVQFKNITKLIRMLEGALNLSKPTRSMLELFKLIAAFMFVLHVFACLWYWAGDYSHRNWQHSWLDTKGQLDVPWSQQYLYAFYFSTVTMFTVGFGDITPAKNILLANLEILISIGFMMICSIQLSYSVNTVGTIINQIFSYEDEKLKKLQTINSYMQNKKISYGLQFQIREYLNYFWSSQNEEDSQEEKLIIDQLSESLKEKLMVEANSYILNTCPLFKQCFSQPLKKRLVKQIKQIVIQPESIVNFDQIFPDHQGEVYICFIEEGEIEIFIENELNQYNQLSTEVSVVYNLKSGSSLGISSFLTGKRTPERLRSVGFAKMLLLSRQDFLKVIQDYPEDYEQFKLLQDNLIFNQNLQFLKMRCFSCGSINHKALDCQMLHYVADRELIIKKIQFSRNQVRNEIQQERNEKRQKSCFSPLLDHEVIMEGADSFQNEHWKWVQFYEDEEEQPKEPVFSIQMSQDETPSQSSQEVEQRRNKTSYLQRQKTRQYNANTLQAIDSDGKLMQVIPEEMPKKKQFKNVIFFDHQEGQIRKKFQKALMLVKSVNNFKKKKFSKSSSKLLLEQSFIQQDQLQRQSLMISTLQQLNNRKKRISQQKKIKMHLNDRISMDYLILKLQMLTRTTKYEVMDYFDTMKSYKYYFVHNNLEEILKKHDEYYQTQKQFIPDLPEIFTKYVQYLMYPYDFIEKYKYVQLTDLHLQIQQHIEAEEQQLDTQKDEQKNLKEQKRKSAKKNMKKSQIRPLSEPSVKKLVQ